MATKKTTEIERKDWKGRSPRVRLSVTHADLRLLNEWYDAWYAANKGVIDVDDKKYRRLIERIAEQIEAIDKPLTETTISYPLLEE